MDKASSSDIANLIFDAPLTKHGHDVLPAMSVHQPSTHYHKQLREAFAPESLDVTDDHICMRATPHRPGGETHFRVYIVSTPSKEEPDRTSPHDNAMLARNCGLVHAFGDQGAGARRGRAHRIARSWIRGAPMTAQRLIVLRRPSWIHQEHAGRCPRRAKFHALRFRASPRSRRR